MTEKTISLHPPRADYEIRVIGSRARPLRDFYHFVLRRSWPSTLALLALIIMLVNSLFAAVYVVTGGIANAAPGSFTDAFFFSVETLATIGYGSMYPSSQAANWVMVLEANVGIILTALATGLLFAKFSRPSARIVFSGKAVILPINGTPTLMFRVGNERGNAIVDAQIRAVVTRNELTAEGDRVYRVHELRLVRDRALLLNRSFSLSHRIDEHSPFHGETPEGLLEREYELQVIVVGLDDTVIQTVHAAYMYYARDIVFGARLRDILSDAPDGALVLDMRNFHELDPIQPTAEFPYPRER